MYINTPVFRFIEIRFEMGAGQMKDDIDVFHQRFQLLRLTEIEPVHFERCIGNPGSKLNVYTNHMMADRAQEIT